MKFYATEREEFQTENNAHFEDTQAELICRKISRHYKIKLRAVTFRNLKCSAGLAHIDHTITFQHEPSLMVICHELAHVYQWSVNRETRHSKKLLRIMRKMLKFAKKKNYWIYQKKKE